MSYLKQNASKNEVFSKSIDEMNKNTKGIVKMLKAYHNSTEMDVKLQDNQFNVVKAILDKEVSGVWLLKIVENATIKSISGTVSVHKTLTAIDWYCDNNVNGVISENNMNERLEDVKKDSDKKATNKSEKDAQKEADERKLDLYDEQRLKLIDALKKLAKIELIARKFKEKKATATVLAKEVVDALK